MHHFQQAIVRLSSYRLQSFRRQLNSDCTDTQNLEPPTGIVFQGLSPSSSVSAQNSRDAANIEMPSALAGSSLKSEHDGNVEVQLRGIDARGVAEAYSPSHNLSKVREHVRTTSQMRDAENMGGRSQWVRSTHSLNLMDSSQLPVPASGKVLPGWSVDRRSSL